MLKQAGPKGNGIKAAFGYGGRLHYKLWVYPGGFLFATRMSLFVQCVLEPKRRTPIGSRGNSAGFVQSNPLVAIDVSLGLRRRLSNRSAVETHEAEMHVDVTLRSLFGKRDRRKLEPYQVASSLVFQPLP
jgi:hypothetical protein